MQPEQIAKLLEDASLGVMGQTIFVNYMPPTVVRGVVILSSLSGTQIDWELGSDWRCRASYQIIVRRPADEYRNGYNLAKNISNVLTITKNTNIPAIGIDIPAVVVRHSRPKHDPISYPRSPNSLLEFSVNFEMCYEVVN